MVDACENEPKVKKAKRESTEVKEMPSDIFQTPEHKLAFSTPLLKAYPKHCEGTCHGKSFVASWNGRYSWVACSQECDAIFCFPFQHFCSPLAMVTLKGNLRRLGFVDGKKLKERTAQ